MKTDIEIAQEAVLRPITEVAGQLQMKEEDLELYGKYKAKISDEYMEKIRNNPDGRLILVTAINPTVIFMRSHPPTICLSPCWIIIFIRETSLGLTPEMWSGRDVSI